MTAISAYGTLGEAFGDDLLGVCVPEPVWWVDAAGTAHPFDEASGICVGRPFGRFMPPTVRREDARADGAGTYLRGLAHGSRRVAVPVVWVMDDRDQLHIALRLWAERMNVLDGEGALRYRTPTGETREVVCAYDSGFELDESRGMEAQRAMPAELVFVAAEPYWRGEETTAGGPWTVGTQEAFLPIPNPTTLSFVQLGSADYFMADVVLYGGTIASYPTWTITGPASGTVSATNDLTGETWELGVVSLAEGEQLVVDADAGTVMQGDESLYSQLTDESVFWPFVEASTPVTILVGGSTGATEVEVTLRPYWLTV